MKRTRIHGEIKDKYIIKNTKTKFVVLENIPKEIGSYPVVFNSINDAEKYLKVFELSEEEKENIKIICTDISFFDNGGILIEM